MAGDGAVCLYRVEGPSWWRTDAAIGPGGELRVVSGGGGPEWHLTVQPGAHDALRRALGARTGQPAETESLLALLAARFRDAPGNPFEPLRALLDAQGIDYKVARW